MDEHQYLLKAHVHLLNLDALLEVFPDACLIFTYRKMTEVLPSFCSTIAMVKMTHLSLLYIYLYIVDLP